MNAFVLDVSACMPWCCEDEATPASERLLQRAALRHPLYVPSLALGDDERAGGRCSPEADRA
jgi:hypothetical protein